MFTDYTTPRGSDISEIISACYRNKETVSKRQ